MKQITLSIPYTLVKVLSTGILTKNEAESTFELYFFDACRTSTFFLASMQTLRYDKEDPLDGLRAEIRQEENDRTLSIWNYFYVFAASIGGSIVQTTTGFGYGIFVMLFFPLFLPLLQSSALSSIIGLWLSASLAWKYRKHADFHSMWLPLVIYILVSNAAVWLSTKVDIGGLKAYFGLFLILVAAYFMFFSRFIHLKANYTTASICTTISGTASGFFGIGGPPMVLYFLALSGADKLKYLATIQAFFFLTGINNVVSRAVNGIITPDLLLLVIPGVLGQIIGQRVGLAIVGRIDIDQLKKLIYFFLAVAGLLTFLTNI